MLTYYYVPFQLLWHTSFTLKKLTDEVLLLNLYKGTVSKEFINSDQEMKAELHNVFYVLEFHRNVQYFELGLRQHTLNEVLA
jgi:hypothetical protein